MTNALCGSALDRLARVAFGSCLVLLLSGPLAGQTTANWQAASGGWSNAANWDCGSGFPGGCVPASGTAVFIGDGGTANVDVNASALSVNISSGSLTVPSAFTLSSGFLTLLGGNLNIGSAGVVTVTSTANLGETSGFEGSVLVSDPGSQLNSGGTLSVGLNGSGAMTVQNGGVVNAGGVSIGGSVAGAVGTVLVTDSGSQLNFGPQLMVGGAERGTLTVQSGAVAGGTNAFVGYNSAAGTLVVTGTGSQFSSSWLTVGNAGQGTLDVWSGATVTEANLFLAQGAISVLGAGSQLNSAGEIAAGYSGQSALTVQTGGVVNGGIILLGYNLGAMASATVVGAGSQLNSTGRLYVGFDGQGTLLISAGGSVSDASAVVGVSTGSSGSVLLSGGTWTTQGSLSIGTVGTGTVQINNGGVLTAGSLTVGSSGALTVDPSVVHSGSFTLASGGVLQLAIAGTDPSLYSQLDLTGAGSFTGTIEFDFTDGFAPQAGDTFDMINFGSGTNFSGATFLVEGLAPGFEYTEIISDDSLTLEALDDGDPAAAPEPATAALLGFGVLGAFIAARTKKSKLR